MQSQCLLPSPRDTKNESCIVGWVENLVCLYLLCCIYNLVKVHHTAPLSKGQNPAQGSSSMSSHHIPVPKEVIEISDSDEPDSSRFTGVDQALPKPPASMTTGPEVIEIMSSDAEDEPQSPQSPLAQMPPNRLRQSTHMRESPDLPDLTPIPPQGVFPLPSQLPEVSSPHEVESMMEIDDPVHHSPPLPPPASSSLPVPHIDPTVDAIERTLSNVTVSPSSPHPPYPPHAFEPVEDSEPEEGPPTEDTHDTDAPQTTPIPSGEDIIDQSTGSDDDFHPPPAPSSSSPSHHIPLSGHPTPTVRHLLYGGPNGIFRDANASIVQYMQTSPPQNPTLNPPTSLLNTHPDGEAEIQPPSPIDAPPPHVPNLPYGPMTTQVNDTFLLFLTTI